MRFPFLVSASLVGDYLRAVFHDRSVVRVVLRRHTDLSLHKRQGTIDVSVKPGYLSRVVRSLFAAF